MNDGKNYRASKILENKYKLKKAQRMDELSRGASLFGISTEKEICNVINS